MSKAYTALAAYYDAFTDDLPYESWAKWAREQFTRYAVPEGATVLDVGCGTGTLTAKLAAYGYDMIGVDASPEMLSCAQRKCTALWLLQPAQALDLYGTVHAAVSSMDAINYLTKPDDLREALRRVALFLEPGGVFLFDALTPAHLQGLDGDCWVRDTDGAVCIHSVTCDLSRALLSHTVELFIRTRGELYRREIEHHSERMYEPSVLVEWLHAAGFREVETYGSYALEPAAPDSTRVLYRALR